MGSVLRIGRPLAYSRKCLPQKARFFGNEVSDCLWENTPSVVACRPALSGLRRTTAPATSNSGTQQGRVPECPGALPGQQRPDRISAAGSRERAHLGHRRHSAVEHRLPRPRARRRAPQWRDGARRHVGASWHRSVGSTSTSPAIHRSEALHRRMPSDLTHTIFLSCVDDMPASFPRSSSPGCLRR